MHAADARAPAHVRLPSGATLNLVTAYEYRRATWDEVVTLGPQGWRLVPLPPVQEVKNVLGQPQMGEPLYAMEREADEPQPGAAAPASAFDAALVRAAAVRRADRRDPLYVTDGEPPTSSGSLP